MKTLKLSLCHLSQLFVVIYTESTRPTCMDSLIHTIVITWYNTIPSLYCNANLTNCTIYWTADTTQPVEHRA